MPGVKFPSSDLKNLVDCLHNQDMFFYSDRDKNLYEWVWIIKAEYPDALPLSRRDYSFIAAQGSGVCLWGTPDGVGGYKAYAPTGQIKIIVSS